MRQIDDRALGDDVFFRRHLRLWRTPFEEPRRELYFQDDDDEQFATAVPTDRLVF